MYSCIESFLECLPIRLLAVLHILTNLTHHLHGAGGSNMIVLFPVPKLAWLCFQSMHHIYKCTVSCLARTAAIFPLQTMHPTKR